MWVFAGRGHINTPDLAAPRLDQRLHVCRDFADVILVELVLRNENVESIKIRFFAELDQGCEIDVAVDDVFHARLRLAHVVNAPADHEWLFDAIWRFHHHGIADAGVQDLKRVALNQDLAYRRRPCALLGFEFADANVAIVFHDKQHQVAPVHRSGFDLARDGPAWFCVADVRVLQHCRDEVIVDRINAQDSRGRIGSEITTVEFTCENRVRRKHGGKGSDAQGNGRHDQNRTRTFTPEVANCFSPGRGQFNIAPSRISIFRSLTRTMSGSWVAITTVVP
jgi:hypothetical protein